MEALPDLLQSPLLDKPAWVWLLFIGLAAMVHRFQYLKYALAAVLVFIGAKIFSVGLIGKTPAAISLGVTFGLIAGGVLWSLWKTRGQAEPAAGSPAGALPAPAPTAPAQPLPAA